MLDKIAKDMASTVRASIEKAVREIHAHYEPILKDLNERIDTIPTPEKGEKGDSVTVEDIKPIIKELVDAIPKPKDGESVSAEDVAKEMEGLFYKWALDFERKADAEIEKAISKLRQPEDGRPGRDAVELKDFDIELLEDGRTVKLSLKSNSETIERSVKISSVLDRGVYKDGQSYEKGDGTSFGGSFWIAQKETDAKPGTSDDWRLAVKRGRDGKESVKVERKKETIKIGGSNG